MAQLKTINERLANELLIKKGLTSYRISKDTGFSTQSIDGWLKGSNKTFTSPSAEALAILCTTYSLDANYILLGKRLK